MSSNGQNFYGNGINLYDTSDVYCGTISLGAKLSSGNTVFNNGITISTPTGKYGGFQIYDPSRSGYTTPFYYSNSTGNLYLERIASIQTTRGSSQAIIMKTVNDCWYSWAVVHYTATYIYYYSGMIVTISNSTPSGYNPAWYSDHGTFAWWW